MLLLILAGEACSKVPAMCVLQDGRRAQLSKSPVRTQAQALLPATDAVSLGSCKLVSRRSTSYSTSIMTSDL
jgi:hypothetical protein